MGPVLPYHALLFHHLLLLIVGGVCVALAATCDVEPCQFGGTCTNVGGGETDGYTCACMDGFTGTNCTLPLYNKCLLPMYQFTISDANARPQFFRTSVLSRHRFLSGINSDGHWFKDNNAVKWIDVHPLTSAIWVMAVGEPQVRSGTCSPACVNTMDPITFAMNPAIGVNVLRHGGGLASSFAFHPTTGKAYVAWRSFNTVSVQLCNFTSGACVTLHPTGSADATLSNGAFAIHFDEFGQIWGITNDGISAARLYLMNSTVNSDTGVEIGALSSPGGACPDGVMWGVSMFWDYRLSTMGIVAQCSIPSGVSGYSVPVIGYFANTSTTTWTSYKLTEDFDTSFYQHTYAIVGTADVKNDTQLCGPHGQCVDDPAHNSYMCQCNTGYTGMACETEINECINQTCSNNGECVDHVGFYVCTCNVGYSGNNCQTNINECSSAPCAAGSTCLDGIDSFSCLCQEGFIGTQCETDVDECASAPCSNGGTCTDHTNSYTCNCVDGYNGPRCESETDECASTPCHHSGICHDQLAGFICTCPKGAVGIYCETDIDDCASAPCKNGATCVDLLGSFNCSCTHGFEGETCQNITRVTSIESSSSSSSSSTGDSRDGSTAADGKSGKSRLSPGDVAGIVTGGIIATVVVVLILMNVQNGARAVAGAGAGVGGAVHSSSSGR